MPQISLYVDDETMAGLRTNAATEGVSLSKYVGRLIRERDANKGYPAGYFKLYGILADAGMSCPEDCDAEPVEALYA